MFNKLVNTRLFSEAAIDFKRNKGRYITAPVGSRDHTEYWEIQEERCMNGYKAGDLWIPGRHYFYLNFTPILKVPDEQLLKVWKEKKDKRGNMGATTMGKILEFPRFYELDYEWYRYKHISWHGGKFRLAESKGAQHICCAKARGAGFSYKEASDGVYNYTFIPDSKSYYFAGIEQYLNKDGILNKVEGMLDFINANIHEWKQNRMKKSTTLHQVASYIDELGATHGNQSEIFGIVVDNPNKTRGKRGRKIVFEEAGSFKRLKEALAVSIGSISDGGFTVGQISLFGTGGEEGPSIEGLEDIFTQPEVYNMLAFPNVWEEGLEGSKCGFFVPATVTDPIFMDVDGNVDREGAMEYQLNERKIKEGAKDTKEVDRYKAEYPVYPSEVFQRMMRNPFNTAEIDKQIRRIETNRGIQALLRYGELVSKTSEEGGGYEFLIKTKADAQPVEEYPHNQKGDLEGCITVVERPYLDAKMKTPADIYQLVFDPFYKEESVDLTSLFACYVMKHYNNIDPVNENTAVAWAVMRPRDINRCYETLFKLADWYNAMIQGEIAGGGQGVYDHAKRNKLLHKLDFEPEGLNNREVTAKKNRTYLMNMATERKRMGLTYLVKDHMDQRGIDLDGTAIFQVHKEYDIGYLRELRKFDGKKNADRISARIVWMFQRREKIARLIQEEEAREGFYERELFGTRTSNDNEPEMLQLYE